MKNYNCEIIGKVLSVEETPDGCNVYLQVKRQSDKDDVLPIVMSNEVLENNVVVPDQILRILGIVKTIRIKGSYKSRLRVEATTVEILPEEPEHKNKVFGRFEVKGSKSARTTTTGYKIKDVILKKAIGEGQFSEFRAILWNDDAVKYDKVPDGTELYIVGRLQCREYTKKTENGSMKVRTYEVSVGKVEDDTDKYAEEV